jgi:hypothetical protein
MCLLFREKTGYPEKNSSLSSQTGRSSLMYNLKIFYENRSHLHRQPMRNKTFFTLAQK